MENLTQKYNLSLKIGETIENLEKSHKIILLDKLHLPDPTSLWPEFQMALGTFNDKLLSMYVLSPTKKPTPQKGLRKMLTPVIFNPKNEFRDMLKEEFSKGLSNLDYEKIDSGEFTDCLSFLFRCSNDLVYRSKDKKELNIIGLKKYHEEKGRDLAVMHFDYYNFFD